MKALILGLFAIVSASAFASPEGSFNCVTKDNKTIINFDIINYGQNILERVNTLKVEGKSLDPQADKSVSIDRQWVDHKMGFASVGLPNGDYFSQILVIKTNSQDGINYSGVVTTQAQKKDFTEAYAAVKKSQIKCTYLP